MFSINYQKNHARQLLGLALATAMLTSCFAVPSRAAIRSTASVSAKANLILRPSARTLKSSL